MKYLIFSDLHGDYICLTKILKIFKEQKCDKIIFLGDLLYHGPRNDLPLNYAPKKVVELLKDIQDKIIFIKGNCDAEVDEMVLNHEPFLSKYEIKIANKNVIFTHGHHLSRFEIDKSLTKNDVVIYGHYHVFDKTIINDVTYINIGSITLPKNNVSGYAILDNDKLICYNLSNNIILEEEF